MELQLNLCNSLHQPVASNAYICLFFFYLFDFDIWVDWKTWTNIHIYKHYPLPVSFEAFKTIDIKDPNQGLWVRILSNWDINFINQPAWEIKDI